MSRIEGKVAAILNERELVLTVGEEQGVQIGMRFDILYSGGIEIADPDSPGTIIGSIEWPKTQVRVIHVYPRLAVARTFHTVTIPAKGIDLGVGVFSRAFHYEPEETVVETLRTDESFAEKELDPSQSVVKIGDLAVQVQEAQTQPSSERNSPDE